MALNRILFFFLIVVVVPKSHLMAQENLLDIRAAIDPDTQQIQISQTIAYTNNSNDTLNTIYLNDWNHAYSSKHTPLAKRFEEEFSTKFLFAKDKEYGFTKIFKIAENDESLNFQRLKDHPDILEVTLNKPLLPNKQYTLQLEYILKLPNAEFTRYGITKNKDLNLKYWYITPTVYDGNWHYYSNKNLDDLFIPKSTVKLQLSFPLNYKATTALNYVDRTEDKNIQTVTFQGNDWIDTVLYLNRFPTYKAIQTDFVTIISDIDEKGLNPADKAILTDRVAQFITQELGAYPQKNLLISNIDDKKNPTYGLTQLPEFIRPFPNHFQYELKLVKATLNKYLENTLLLNPRKDYWLIDALEVYYLMKFSETHYPDMKLLGSLAKFWGIRSFHAADLDFNTQYKLAYMHMARTNRDQKITMQKDSLLKFNENLAGKYKAGLGLKYLDDFINDNILEESIKSFIQDHKLSIINSIYKNRHFRQIMVGHEPWQT